MNWLLLLITKIITPFPNLEIGLAIAPWLGYALATGGISGLAGFLGARAEEERGKGIAEERRKRARSIFGERVVSPYAGAVESMLSRYLRGELTPEQEAGIAQERRLGEAGIARTAATYGMPGGARAGLGVQLGRDIAIRKAGLIGEQQRLGLAAYLRGEQEKAREKELMLQYLT